MGGSWEGRHCCMRGAWEGRGRGIIAAWQLRGRGVIEAWEGYERGVGGVWELQELFWELVVNIPRTNLRYCFVLFNALLWVLFNAFNFVLVHVLVIGVLVKPLKVPYLIICITSNSVKEHC